MTAKSKSRKSSSIAAEDMELRLTERKPRKRKISTSEDDDDDTESTNSPSISKRENGRQASSHNKPAELFRKDLISAMKLPDQEPLAHGEFFRICDPWRQEWEKGVQVPVNAEKINRANVNALKEKSRLGGDFKLPRKFLHTSNDETYKAGLHELTGMHELAEQVCRYDLDEVDVEWLDKLNEIREDMGECSVQEWTMEKVMEELERQCYDNMQKTIKTKEGLGIEYDENVLCDVCRSPDSEDNNEIVFCDGCDIGVHQACYGITSIPEGNWLCRTCALGIKPLCILCPRKGGAMKSTKSGTKWAHVSCALWIPEVSIGCVEKMEPITKISQIPASRWALICTLCRERTGACIQCAVKTCKTAFHVTCAFSQKLVMETILDNEFDEDDGVKLRGFCPKHTNKKDRIGSDSPSKKDDEESDHDLSTEEGRHQRLKELEDIFYTCVQPTDVAKALDLEESVVDFIFNYWKLKRKANYNKAFLTPKTEEADFLSKQQEDSLLARMKMFVQLRQDLEKVRNLCFMVKRREKICRELYKENHSVFTMQSRMLCNDKLKFSKDDMRLIKEGNQSNNIVYDFPELFQRDSYLTNYFDRPEIQNITPNQTEEMNEDMLAQQLLEESKETSLNKKSTAKQNSLSIDRNTDKPIIKDEKDERANASQHKREIEILTGLKNSPRGKGGSGKGKSDTAKSNLSQGGKSHRGKGKKDVEQEDIENVGAVDRRADNRRLRGDPLNDRKRSKSDILSDSVSDKEPVEYSERKLRDRDSVNNNKELLDRTLSPKKEVNGVVKKNPFVISDIIKDKVHNGIKRGRKIRPYMNGLRKHIKRLTDPNQRTLDGYFRPRTPERRKLRPVNDPSIHKVHDNGRLQDEMYINGQSSPRYKKSPPRVNRKISQVDSDFDGYNSPETRSTRRKIASGLKSGSRMFSNVDDEISISLSSREPSPELTRGYQKKSRRELDSRLKSTLKQRNLSGNDSADSESEASSESSLSVSTRRRTRSRAPEIDESSRDSTNSNSTRSTRSKLSDSLKFPSLLT
ncbi:unnamed protein product [Owenia fusiformis]|uniref:Uncharacterized protein n=1 Tax=Owenia fusiformis TaxID=6347 RepID=A0A8S4NC37_OWEFU|nr:unnamed protein product [Owenia fusiformis]